MMEAAPAARTATWRIGFQVAPDQSRLPKPGKISELFPMNATIEADPTKAYNQDDATGFIRLNGLRLKVAAKVHAKKK